MVLSFEKGFFVLRGAQKTVSQDLENNEDWETVSSVKTQFKTTALKQAVRFRRYADEVALRVLDRILVKRYLIPPGRLPSFLDPHQKAGIEWILTRSRSYIAHAPGAGKSCQAIIAACQIPGPGKSLFIVPPSLVENWKREIELWATWPPPSISSITAGKTLSNYFEDFVIVADSLLTRPDVLEQLFKQTWKFVAVDEASRFKEPTAQRTIALFGGNGKNFYSPGIVQKARNAVLMDGSPMPNRPMELWAPTYAMAPEEIDFMQQTEFGFKFCGARMNSFGRWEFKYATNEKELKEKLTRNFMHVVTEDELNHPERMRSMVFIEDVRTPEIKTWEKRHLKNINLASLGEGDAQGTLAKMRRELGLRKVPSIAAYVREKLEKGESLLLFCWHREVAYALSKSLYKFKPCLVMGGTAALNREKYFAAFQDGRRKIIIGNISAMGRGHNLQRAGRVVFGEFSWTDELNRQCEKRVSRKGRDRKRRGVRCDYVISSDSMDEIILRAVFAKAKAVKEIIG